MASFTIPTPLRKFTDQKRRVEADGSTVKEALDTLVKEYPELKKNLYDDNDQLRSYVKIYLDEQEIGELDGTDTKIEPGTELNIIPAIAGGCGSCCC